MAISGQTYVDPQNERWAEAVERAIRERDARIDAMQKTIDNLTRRINNLQGA